jgi:hypothetical protein
MNVPYQRLYGAIAVFGFALVVVDAHASAPTGRYTVNGGTVLDKQTKLVWQRTPSTTTYSLANAKTACAAAGATLGGNGWRVPTIKELQTLIDYSQPYTTALIDGTAFPSTGQDNFWSSTPLSGSTSMAWYVSFLYGNAASDVVTTAFYVRCVR